MAKLSKRRLLIEAFTACGCHPAKLRTTKYVGFVRDGRTYLIGKSGALRTMKNGEAVADSRSLTGNRWYRALLVVGKRGVDDCYSSSEQARADLEYEYRGETIAQRVRQQTQEQFR